MYADIRYNQFIFTIPCLIKAVPFKQGWLALLAASLAAEPREREEREDRDTHTHTDMEREGAVNGRRGRAYRECGGAGRGGYTTRIRSFQ